MSLLHDGDFNLAEYQPDMEKVNYFGLLCVAEDGSFTYLPEKPRNVQRSCIGRYIYLYPLAGPVLSTPAIWGVETALEAARAVLTVMDQTMSPSRPPRALVADILAAKRFELERLVAALFVALATVLVFFFCAEELPWTWAAGLALLFAFATPAWSIGSRGLWQHTVSMPLLAASLWILSVGRRRPNLVPLAGLALMTAFWVRPTNLVSVAVFSTYVLVFHRSQLIAFLAAMIPPFLAFGGINYSIYGNMMPPYSNAGRVATLLKVHTQFGEALAANLISPGRGLFVFSPVLALGGLAAKPAGGDRNLNWLRLGAIVVIILHWLLLSSVVIWWAGHCFGPRFFTDMAPLLVFLLIPAVQRIRAGNRALAILGVLLLGWSTLVHYQGATSQAAVYWNISPMDIDKSPWRVWDWSHTSFLAGFETRTAGQKR